MCHEESSQKIKKLKIRNNVIGNVLKKHHIAPMPILDGDRTIAKSGGSISPLLSFLIVKGNKIRILELNGKGDYTSKKKFNGLI
jgi:hypothetical protein